MAEKKCSSCGVALQFCGLARIESIAWVDAYKCNQCGKYEFYEHDDHREDDPQDELDKQWLTGFQEKVRGGLITEKPFTCPKCGNLRRDKICPICGQTLDLATMTEDHGILPQISH